MGMYLWFVELTGERSQGSILLYIRKSLECTQNWNGVIIMYSRERERERERDRRRKWWWWWWIEGNVLAFLV